MAAVIKLTRVKRRMSDISPYQICLVTGKNLPVENSLNSLCRTKAPTISSICFSDSEITSVLDNFIPARKVTIRRRTSGHELGHAACVFFVEVRPHHFAASATALAESRRDIGCRQPSKSKKGICDIFRVYLPASLSESITFIFSCRRT